MIIPDALVLGPLALSLRLVVPLVSFAAAALLGGILLRHERELRTAVFDMLMNGVLLFFLGWKLTPVVALLLSSPSHIASDPMIMLYIPGGRSGALVGGLLAGLYLLFLFVRNRSRVQSALAPLALIAGTAFVLSAIGGLGIEIARSASGATGAGRISAVELGGGQRVLYPQSGRPLVLNFWASWCGPCRAENQVKAQLHEEFGDRVDLIGVNLIGTEAGPEVVAAYAERWGLSFPMVLDYGGAVAGAYAVRGTPTTVFINAEGQLVDRIFGAMSYGQAGRILQNMLK